MNKEIQLNPLFIQFINQSRSGKRLKKDGTRISTGTVKNYEAVFKLLQLFSEKKRVLLKVPLLKGNNQRQFKSAKNYWKKFYRRLTNFLYSDCKHFDNYVGTSIKILRAFFAFVQKEKNIQIGDFYKEFRVTSENIQIITLVPEQLNYLILDQGFHASLSNRERIVKDIFVFGCTVGLRFSDLMNIFRGHLLRL